MNLRPIHGTLFLLQVIVAESDGLLDQKYTDYRALKPLLSESLKVKLVAVRKEKSVVAIRNLSANNIHFFYS
jgi:hypothetical protein